MAHDGANGVALITNAIKSPVVYSSISSKNSCLYVTELPLLLVTTILVKGNVKSFLLFGVT